MKRGDFVTIALQGDFGKPRPALVIQSDLFAAHSTVTVLLLSSTLIEAPLFRVTVEPNDSNGLRARSQIMVDKTMTVVREKVGRSFGELDEESLLKIERNLALFLGIAK
jgi:mRNA interferase MazF